MISIIICSKYRILNKVVQQNIYDTIGCNYEIILIDNSENKYSIFSAYNKGVEMAKYPFLCFIHEDFLFRTNNWGNLICKVLNDELNGVIGVIGSKIMMDLSFGWWEVGSRVGTIIQNQRTCKMHHINSYKTISQPILEDAVALDGLFLAMPRSIFAKISFDENTYSGFHCYDIDICMQAIDKGYKVKVVNILIEHYSVGYVDYSFVDAMFLFLKKWKYKLPVYSSEITPSDFEFVRDNAIYSILKNKVDLSRVNTRGIRKVVSTYIYMRSILGSILNKLKNI